MSREEEYLAARVRKLEERLEMAHMKIGHWRATAIGVPRSLAWSAEDERMLEMTLESARGRRTGT